MNSLGQSIIAVMCLACVACVTEQPTLEPVGTTDSESRVEVNGIAVEVEPDAWRGSDEVRASVIPLRVTFANDSDRPMLLRYQDLSLATDSGRGVTALPPFAVHEAVEDSLQPRFEHEDFRVAPDYDDYYDDDDLVVYDDDFEADDDYYDERYEYWEDAPTEEMLEVALPEGVLEPGGEVTGFVYFEPIGLDVGDEVVLRAHLVGPDDTGDLIRLATVELPFRYDL